jgi:hypothetical protein
LQNQNQSTVILVGFLFMTGIFLSGDLYAQSLIISGKVIDAKNHEPLAYATIGIEGEAYGTITNLAGEFDLHVPSNYHNRELIISTLGYQDYKIEIETASKQNILLVLLEPGHTVLDEVMISKDLSAANLLNIALTRIELNYPMSPTEMEGFYRDIKKVDDDYVGLIEAAVKIYDKNYQKPRNASKLRERVSLIELRRTIDYDYKLEKYFNQYNMLEDLLLENLVKYRTFNNEKEFFASLQRKIVPGYNNKPIDMVFIEQPGYSLKVYIDENYGIRKIVFNWGNGEDPVYSYRKSRKLENQVMLHEKQIEFQEYNGKLYLKYIASSYVNNWTNRKTLETEIVTRRDQTLLVNKINDNNPRWIPNSEKMKRYGLQFQHSSYNKDFWDHYNVIKDMPLNGQVIFDLEKWAKLEDQFASFE